MIISKKIKVSFRLTGEKEFLQITMNSGKKRWEENKGIILTSSKKKMSKITEKEFLQIISS
jgi:hypothetical protein